MDSKILLVDDEEKNVMLLEAMLSGEGYSILKAKNGTGALEILKSEIVEMVLLDIMMPGMSGFDVLKKIREDKDLSTLPVIVITALTEKQERIKGLQLGADDFISKPFDMDELKTKVGSQIKLNNLRKHLNQRAKLTRIINKIDEGIIVTDAKFMPINVNLKARSMLELKEIPENIVDFLNDRYGKNISPGPEKTGYVLRQKGNDMAKGISITIEQIKDSESIIDSYVFILREVYSVKDLI